MREPLNSHGSCQPFADHLAVAGRRPLKPAPPACAVGQFYRASWLIPFAPLSLQEVQHYYWMIRP